MTSDDKASITAMVIQNLEAELAGFTRAAKAAHAAATDPDSKAENKYDTRNLEASYLARGVAFRVAETEAALSAWESMPPRDFSAMLPIGTGALVLLENAQGAAGYFMGPGGGGITVEHNRLEITVITVVSPLGKQLLKRREGEVFLMETGAHRDQTIITAVI